MTFPNKPTFGQTVCDIVPIQVSVSSEASAAVNGAGICRGFFALVSTSFTITSPSGKRLAVDNLTKNSIIWVQGYASTINASAATSTATFSGDAAILFGVF